MNQTGAPQPSPLAPLAAQPHRPARLRRSTAQPHRYRSSSLTGFVLCGTFLAVTVGIGTPTHWRSNRTTAQA